MKLELKHLAPYLPYGLKMNYTNPNYEYDVMTLCDKRGLSNVDIGTVMDTPNFYKPLLHPLSRLTDKQKKFLYFEVISIDNDMYGNLDEFIDYLNETSEYHLPYCIYRQLTEWHYDVFGLIEKGLAEPIETSKAKGE